MNLPALKARLRQEEGLRLKPYRDTMGIWTIGYGHNLTARGISQAIADELLDDDIAETIGELFTRWPWMAQLDDARQVALADMCFNMGADTLAEFRDMLSALKVGQWPKAAQASLDSVWASQVGNRAIRISEILRTGVLPI